MLRNTVQIWYQLQSIDRSFPACSNLRLIQYLLLLPWMFHGHHCYTYGMTGTVSTWRQNNLDWLYALKFCSGVPSKCWQQSNNVLVPPGKMTQFYYVVDRSKWEHLRQYGPQSNLISSMIKHSNPTRRIRNMTVDDLRLASKVLDSELVRLFRYQILSVSPITLVSSWTNDIMSKRNNCNSPKSREVAKYKSLR